MKTLKRAIKRTLNLLGISAFNRREPSFTSSSAYWESRYRAGKDSGIGSYGRLAVFKARVINEFVTERGIRSVIELGCGDGNQLKLANYETYLGFDVSPEAIRRCTSSFSNSDSYRFKLLTGMPEERAELTLSLDVIFHLVEDHVFESYLSLLFGCSERYVIIYSSNFDRFNPAVPHVRHREFLPRVAEAFPSWKLIITIPSIYPRSSGEADTSYGDFYFFEKQA